MARFVVITIVAVLILSAACLALADPVADKSGKLTIEIPEGWTQAPGTDLFDLTAADKIARINISTETVPKELTLQLFEGLYVAQAKKSLKAFSLVSQDKCAIDGVPAGVWVYTAKVDGVKLEFKNYIAFKDGRMYNIVFATLPDLYKQDVAGLGKIIGSLKWL